MQAGLYGHTDLADIPLFNHCDSTIFDFICPADMLIQRKILRLRRLVRLKKRRVAILAIFV
jgi:hypothetical protein